MNVQFAIANTKEAISLKCNVITGNATIVWINGLNNIQVTNTCFWIILYHGQPDILIAQYAFEAT